MIILGLDSSALAGSAAVLKDGKLLSEFFINTGLTHSQTLMPLADKALKYAGVTMADVDLLAVTNGPGSFTGIRIGAAAVKGLAQPCGIPCYPVSTLEAIAYPLRDSECTAVSVMDARCEQVYAALFGCCGNAVSRLSEDRAIALSELKEILNLRDGKKILIGDGAEIAFDYLKDAVNDIFIASPQIRFQRASSAAFIAENDIENKGKTPIAPAFLAPVYLRMPQAERELKKQKK